MLAHLVRSQVMGEASGLRAHRFTGGGLRELLDRQGILAGATAESRRNAPQVSGIPPATP
jgi:hypothetical protein